MFVYELTPGAKRWSPPKTGDGIHANSISQNNACCNITPFVT